jgi:hypothetical protein
MQVYTVHPASHYQRRATSDAAVLLPEEVWQLRVRRRHNGICTSQADARSDAAVKPSEDVVHDSDGAFRYVTGSSVHIRLLYEVERQ